MGGRRDYQGRLPERGDILVGDLKNRYELMRCRRAGRSSINISEGPAARECMGR